MGLAERRATKEFQDNRYPQLKKEIDEAVGFEIAVEVKWEQLAEDGMVHLYEDCWAKVYFRPLIDALKAITADDMGKQALKESLKSIVLRNEADNSYGGDRIAKFDKGTGQLAIDHKPFSNVDDHKDMKEGIQKTLEDSL